MCLEIIAILNPDAKSRISANRLSKISGLAVSSQKIDGTSCLHFAVTVGCSCEFLSDSAEFESDTWALEASHLPKLAKAVDALAQECGRFSFVAHWLGGEHERHSQEVSTSDFMKIVVENQIKNNVLYIVG